MQLRIPQNETIELIKTIPHKHITEDLIQRWWTYYYVPSNNQNSKYGEMKAQAVCWLYCWAMTGMGAEPAKIRSRQVFNLVFIIEYEQLPQQEKGTFHEWAKKKRKSEDDKNIEEEFLRKLQEENVEISQSIINEETRMDDHNDYLKKLINLLEENRNLILTGAPGTGKTYLAKDIAKRLIFPDKPDKYYEDEEELNKDGFDDYCNFVQFHPSYDYTDFIEGLRPIPKREGNQIGFELKNGTFKKFCKDALETWKKDKQQKYIFIIDEINRGEISKIFGELFFSIDPGYRGEKGKVTTQYANMQSDNTVFDPEEGEGCFYIPENVYIIGTMNDIDRSVESFDFAMRRRFVWQEITAEKSADNMDLPEGTKKRMKILNDAISKIDGLNSSYHIGASYFRKEKDGKIIEPDYDKLWNLRLKFLLREYLRGMPDAEEKLNNLEKTYCAPSDEQQ